MKNKGFNNQRGIAPILLLVSVIGLMAFLLTSSVGNFKHGLFGQLFFKKESYAATTDCATGADVGNPSLSYSIDAQNFPLGAYSSSLDPNWNVTPGQVVQNNYWTPTQTHYFISSNYPAPVFESKTCSRDMEADVWVRNGYVVLRKAADGSGIYFRLNLEVPGGQLEIGILQGDSSATYMGTRKFNLWGTSTLNALIPDYKSYPTDGDYFTFGVEGYDIYAKFKGQEFVRFQEYRDMKTGRVSAKAETSAGYGIRQLGVRHMPDKTLFSDYAHNNLDLRDLGLKSIQTTGSVVAGSNQITLAAVTNPVFKVNDKVIVELGGEAGQGMRGTIGVGGSWPKKSYADLTAMQQDSSQIDWTYAYLQNDGTTYQWNKGASAWSKIPEVNYYTARVFPKALKGTITNISADQKVLTIDSSAQVSSTNANVYYDNADIFNRWMKSPTEEGSDFTDITPQGTLINIPEGQYAIGQGIVLYRHPGWKIVGAGADKTTIFSPKGVTSASFGGFFSPNMEVRNLHWKGNARDNGFGLAVSETNVPQGGAFPGGVMMGQASDNSLVADLTVTDVFQKAAASSFAHNNWAKRVKNIMTDGLRQYVQWQFQWSDSNGGGCEDCSVYSPTLTGGFESFKGSGVQFIRPFGQNATVSFNNAQDYLIKDGVIKALAGSNNNNDWFSPHNPMVNVNSNIGADQVANGGTIQNITLIQEGFLNTLGSNHDNMIGIIVNDQNPNIKIFGGSYTAPDYTTPTQVQGAFGINSTGPSTTIDGFRVVGKASPSWGNINVLKGSVSNCVAEKIVVSTGVTVTNCQGAVYIGGVLQPSPSPTPTSTPTPLPSLPPSPPPADTTKPTVSITNPVNNASVARKANVTISANATDNVKVAKVEFYVGGSLISTDATTPYTASWVIPNAANKSYTIMAKAYDISNNSSSVSINIIAK